MKRLTVSLPDDVWDRLHAEARAADKTIGTFAKDLIVSRDRRRNPVSETSDTTIQQKEV